MTWEKLAAMTPDEIKSKNLWPAGFYPLSHPHHEAGGMVFPKPQIDEVQKENARDLTRFDLDYDVPQHLLPEFPAPIYLTTRPDLGDRDPLQCKAHPRGFEPLTYGSEVHSIGKSGLSQG